MLNFEDDIDKKDDDLMGDWDKMMNAPPQKAMDQSEIDNLFGGSGPSESKDVKGVKALLDSAMSSYEKLPMLEIVFDKLIRLLTTSLRNLTSETVDIDINNFSSLRVGSYMNTIPMPTLISVFKAVEWENLGLLIIDSSLIFTLVEILFGGKKNNFPLKIEGRAHTDIEQALVRQISELILSELSSSFDLITPITFNFERMESNPNFATIARPGDAAILLQLKINIENKGGKVDILIPYVTLEPVKNLLTQVFMGERYGVDNDWEESFTNRILGAEFPIEAVIINKPVKLSEVINLQVGHTIMIDHDKDSEVLLKIEEIEVFSGHLGKVENYLAVSINKFLIELKEEQ